MLAHLLGDGSSSEPDRYASTDGAERPQWAPRQARGIAARDEYPAARCTTLRLSAPYHLTHGRRNPIAAWLDSYGLYGLRSHEKFIPDPVFAAPKRQIALFLRHLWATDGCVWWDAGAGQARIYYASTSRRLIDDVAQLLMRFNVMTRVKEIRKGGYRPCYHLLVYGAENQLRFLDDIGVHGARSVMAEKARAMLAGIKGNTNGHDSARGLGPGAPRPDRETDDPSPGRSRAGYEVLRQHALEAGAEPGAAFPGGGDS
jgi:replicative DNA helicase